MGFVPESMTGQVQEDVIERGTSDAHAVDLAWEGLDQHGHELMSAVAFDVQKAIDQPCVDGESFARFPGQNGRLAGDDRKNVAADCRFQGGGRTSRHQPAAIEDRNLIAFLGFVHQVRGQETGHPHGCSKLLQIVKQSGARAGVESGRRFVEDEQAGLVQKALRDLDTALHAAREPFDSLIGAVAEPKPSQHFIAAGAERRSRQSIQMPLVREVLQDAKLPIEAGPLKDDTNVPADLVTFEHNVIAGDQSYTGFRPQQCREDAKKRGLAAAVWTQKGEQRAGADLKRDIFQRAARGVIVRKAASLYDEFT
jgi:hypothetical protein